MPKQLRLAGLQASVTVDQDAYAIPHIFAANDHDLFYAQGYLVARDRLAQMDLMRRQGSGRLAEILGPDLVGADQLQLTLGLRRTAEESAPRLKQAYPQIYDELQAYADGVNAWIDEARRTHAWPAFFRLLGYTPQHWTVIDSLVVQGVMVEDLALSMDPLKHAVLTQKLGAAQAATLFPEMPANEWHAYNPGPYPPGAPVDSATLRDRLLPFGNGDGQGVGGLVASASVTAPAAAPTAVSAGASADPVKLDSTELIAMLNAVDQGRGPFTGGFTHEWGNSNNWVVGGALTDTGKPYLAGDPHLGLTLPAIWYELQLDSPNVHAYGVNIPGTPGIIIGHTRHVAWSLTNVQNIQTFFYAEKTDPGHPGAYLHNGQWLPFKEYKVDIPVKGQATRHIVIPWTVHGAVLSQLPGVPPLQGQTISIAYTGDLLSNDFGALDGLTRANNVADVKAALALWGSPTQNFAYATTDGDFGIISAGYYPLIAQGEPNQPLSGTGESDWIGMIPFDRIPQVHNPAWGFAFSANQREVGTDYPYYIGSSDNYFDAGYRAESIYRFLSDPANRPITQQKMADLQASNHDDLARRVVPVLVAAIRAVPDASPQARQAADVLATWNFEMTKDQAAPAIWETFYTHYLVDTFGPWWQAAGLEQVKGFSFKDFRLSQGGWKGALMEDLETLTVSPKDSPEYKALADAGSGQTWFDDPVQHRSRSREDVMVQALGETMADLAAKLGPDPAKWQWGDVHHRLIPSLTQAKALARGPYRADGDGRTPNATGGDPATHGPSWRMVANLADISKSWGTFPGGESGDPTSPHYADQVPLWLNYQYKTLVFPAAPQPQGDWVKRVVTLQPAGTERSAGSGTAAGSQQGGESK